MRACIIALPLLPAAIPATAHAQDAPGPAAEAPAQPPAQDNLKLLGGQLLIELLSRATSGNKKALPPAEPAATPEPVSEVVQPEANVAAPQ